MRKKGIIIIAGMATIILASIGGIVYQRDQKERNPEWADIELEGQKLHFPFSYQEFEKTGIEIDSKNEAEWEAIRDLQISPNGFVGGKTVVNDLNHDLTVGIRNNDNEPKTYGQCDIATFDYSVWRPTSKELSFVVADKISIGDKKEEIVRAFGEPQKAEKCENGWNYYYKTRYINVEFQIWDNTIHSILYSDFWAEM